MECGQVVPLLSSSPDELKLIVGRRPAPMFDETDELFDADEEGDEHRSPMIDDNSIENSSMDTNLHEKNNGNYTTTTTNNNNNDDNTNSTTATQNTFSLLSQSKTSTV